jgi:hypothetical protein
VSVPDGPRNYDRALAQPSTNRPKQRAELTRVQKAIFAYWNENYLGSVLPQQFGRFALGVKVVDLKLVIGVELRRP